MMTSTDPNRLPDARDLFEVRTRIVQHTNPLQAKILVFSVVYRPFDFSTRDWLALKSKEFYDLLQSLYAKSSTLVELEEKLYATARSISQDDDEKIVETARIILKYMHRLYDDEVEDVSDSLNLNDDDDETQLFDTDATEVEWNPQNSDRAVIFQEREDLDEFEHPLEFDSGDDTGQTISYAADNYDLPDSQLSYDDSENPSIDHRPDEFSHSSSNLNLALEVPSSSVEFDRDGNVKTPHSQNIGNDNPTEGEIFKIADRVADSLFRKMNLAQEIEYVVNQQVKDSTLAFQNTLSEVESRLDDRLLEEPESERVFLKYQALQMLTQKLQGHLATIKDILAKQEMAFVSTAFENLENGTSQPEESSEDGLLEDSAANLTTEPIALKDWIVQLDRTLKTREITTLTTIKNGCLHLVFESEREFNPQRLVAFVKKKIVDLEISTIEQIQVHGRKRDRQSLDWTEIVYP